MHLDFTLLRLVIDDSCGKREILKVESISKPELPKSTLDLIRQKKQGDQEGFFEFALILEDG